MTSSSVGVTFAPVLKVLHDLVPTWDSSLTCKGFTDGITYTQYPKHTFASSVHNVPFIHPLMNSFILPFK